MQQSFSLFDLWRSLAILVPMSLIVMGSPGPSTLSATAVGAAFGFRRSLAYLGGLILGTSAVLLMVAGGIMSILLSLPQAASGLLALSGAYMLYLAYRIATAPPPSQPQSQTRPPSLVGGFLLAVANPKAYMAIAAVFTGAGTGVGNPAIETAVKVGVLVILIVLIHLAWLLVGTSLTRVLRHPVWARTINGLFAATLVAATLGQGFSAFLLRTG